MLCVKEAAERLVTSRFGHGFATAAECGVIAIPTANRPGQNVSFHMSSNAEIPYRDLGRTGERVSAIGVGGWI